MSKEEFTKAVLESEKNMYYAAKTILSNDEDCADAMQSAILSAYSKLNTLQNEKYFKTWLIRILVNECYSMIRKKKATISYEEYMKKEETVGAPEHSEVYMEIQALEEKYRVPFVLHYIEGYTVKEVAYILKKSEASIKMSLFRTRNILKERLSIFREERSSI